MAIAVPVTSYNTAPSLEKFIAARPNLWNYLVFKHNLGSPFRTHFCLNFGISQKGSPERCRFRLFPFVSVFFFPPLFSIFFCFLPFPSFPLFSFIGFRFFLFSFFLFSFSSVSFQKKRMGDTVRETTFAKPREFSFYKMRASMNSRFFATGRIYLMRRSFKTFRVQISSFKVRKGQDLICNPCKIAVLRGSGTVELK